MEEIPTTSGIYQILCMPTRKIYIGSAVNLRKRWREHRSALNRGKHHNRYLQYAWNKYGEAHFAFSILEAVEPGLLINREQHWIDSTNCCDIDIGFNLSPTAGSTVGTIHSEASKAKRRATWARRRPPSAKIRLTRGEAARRRYANIDQRNQARRLGLAQWADPVKRDRTLSGIRNSAATPKYREAKREVAMRTWANPEIRARRIAGVKNTMATPEFKTRHSMETKQRMDNPEVRARCSEGTKAAWARRKAKLAQDNGNQLRLIDDVAS